MKQAILALITLAIVCSFASCEKSEELPPILKENTGKRAYKLPDPRPLNADEAAREAAIKKEYNDNAK
ncbi:MAG: hypothetical protein SPK09_01550 [Porphyromonas sp.]|nr:hypothetical protein [Porphyromonas sp.]